MNGSWISKHQIALFIGTLVLLTSTGCIKTVTGIEERALNETVSAQSTELSHLTTQIAQQDETIASQWGAISYLSTQMPFALGLITPIPPGVRITQTPYSERDPNNDLGYPTGTRSGNDEIDNLIEAVMNRDIDARLDLIRYTNAACTTLDGLGGPPKCQGDEEDGTLVSAFPISNGEGTHIRPESIRTAFDFKVRRLYAIYLVQSDAYETDYWPAGEYGVVFTSEEGGFPHVVTVFIEGGQIVRLAFDPGWPPFDLILAKSNEFILPPTR